MNRSIPFAAALASAAALALPSLAEATTYCVAKPSCEAAGGTHAASLEQALGFASFLSAGRDRVEIGPGDFFSGPGFSYGVKKTGESVEIVGAGPGQTRLLHDGTSTPTLALTGLPESSVSDLTIVPPNGEAVSLDPGVGLVLSGEAKHVDVGAKSSDYYNAVRLIDGKLTDATIEGSDSATAVYGPKGTASIARTRIETAGRAIDQIHGGQLGLGRVRIDAKQGVNVSQGSVSVVNSLILTHGQPALDTRYGASTINADHVTLVGDGSKGSAGILAGQEIAGGKGHVTLDSSIVTGYASSLVVDQGAGLADIKVRYSDYDAYTVSAAPGQVDQSQGNLHLFPGFTSAGTSDYHLRADSPLIDAADPKTGLAADFDGADRTQDGNGDGSAIADIGAFESPAVPPVVKVPPTKPPVVEPPQPPTGPVEDTTPPVITSLALSRTRFSVSPAAKPSFAHGRGTRFRIKLSKDARVKITIRYRLKRHKLRTVGSLTRSAHSGRNTIGFGGRLGRRTLKPGRYLAVALATDAAHRRSAKRTVGFTVLARRR